MSLILVLPSVTSHPARSSSRALRTDESGWNHAVANKGFSVAIYRFGAIVCPFFWVPLKFPVVNFLRCVINRNMPCESGIRNVFVPWFVYNNRIYLNPIQICSAEVLAPEQYSSSLTGGTGRIHSTTSHYWEKRSAKWQNGHRGGHNSAVDQAPAQLPDSTCDRVFKINPNPIDLKDELALTRAAAWASSGFFDNIHDATRNVDVSLRYYLSNAPSTQSPSLTSRGRRLWVIIPTATLV